MIRDDIRSGSFLVQEYTWTFLMPLFLMLILPIRQITFRHSRCKVYFDSVIVIVAHLCNITIGSLGKASTSTLIYSTICSQRSPYSLFGNRILRRVSFRTLAGKNEAELYLNSDCVVPLECGIA